MTLKSGLKRAFAHKSLKGSPLNDPPPGSGNSATNTDAHSVSHGQPNLFGCINNRRNITINQSVKVEIITLNFPFLL